MNATNADAYLAALLAAPRPGAEKILAFYDARVGHICTDARLLFLPLDDHICHRGDGLFESICWRDRRIFGLDEHLARLRDGANALSLTPPCPWEDVAARIIDTVRAAERDHGDVRVFLSRGPGGFGVAPSECPVPGLYIVALKSDPPSEAFYQKGLTAFASAVPPKQDYLARIKSTNYLPNVFMAAEAHQKGMDIAITFDEHGVMGEAAVANVAIIDKDGRLLCPELTRILAGTTLLAAMAAAADFMPVLHGQIRREDIAAAREMLLFGSAPLCVAITHFDNEPVGHGERRGRPGPVAFLLRDELAARLPAEGTPF